MGQLQQTDAASQMSVGGTSTVTMKEVRDHLGAYGSVSPVCVAHDERCRGFGQTEAQHSGSIFKTACISLLDVLLQVPTLPEILTADSQKALSATCKSCRVQFTAQVQVVTILRKEDYVEVFERGWPRLRMVILQYAAAFCTVPQPSNSTRTINFQLSARGNKLAAILLLRPLHSLAIGLPWTRLDAAQQLAHQMRVRWPLMSIFTTSRMHDLDGLGPEIVSQLVKGTWQMQHLSLSGCELEAAGFLLLSQGNWPGLTYLDVSRNCLDAEGMALLAKGNWPVLATINLSLNPTMDAAAIAHLSVSNWRIESLTMEGMPFSADMVAELAELQLPNLRALHLMGSGLTAAAVYELARAIRPSLKHLDNDHDDLAALYV